jgi:2-hydroxymuconate-semialdehyde hydrolase
VKGHEYDVPFASTSVHFVEGGQGFPVLLLHGTGPGVSVIGNFRGILDALAERYHVFGMDWIGFGASGRLGTPPFFDLALWEQQVRFALERIAADRVGILAHSLGAAVALRVAATDRRVVKLLTTGAMGAPFSANEYTRSTWTFPASPEALRRTMEMLVYDRSLLTDEFIANRFENLQRGAYQAYFSSMFEGSPQQYVDAAVVPEAMLATVQAEVLMMHGRDDVAFPVATTTILTGKIRQADAWILGRCRHSVALEYPEKVLAAAHVLFR